MVVDIIAIVHEHQATLLDAMDLSKRAVAAAVRHAHVGASAVVVKLCTLGSISGQMQQDTSGDLETFEHVFLQSFYRPYFRLFVHPSIHPSIHPPGYAECARRRHPNPTWRL
jgi:hypothetical protein